MEQTDLSPLDQRAAHIHTLRTEAHRLREIEDHPPIQTLITYALQALDEAEKWIGKQRLEQRQPLMALVDLEIKAAEGRLKVVIDLLELYGTDMGWND